MALSCILAMILLRALVAEAASGIWVNPDPSWGTAPASNGRAQLVLALAEVGNRVYLGGEFTKMVNPSGGSSETRNHLAAIDPDSGDLLSWNPNADGTVRDMALSADRTRLYIGGDFNRIGGQSAKKVALLNLATGKIDPTFRPAVSGRVRALALRGNRLYVGGDFTKVGSAARSKVAALDATTGALLDWNPPAISQGRYVGHTGTPTPDAPSGNVYSLAVPADGSRVYVAGSFLDFAGQGGLLVLDAATAQPLPQQWKVGRPVFDVTIWPGDGWTLFAATGGAGGRLYAFRPNQPKRPLWTVGVDGDAVGVAASTNTVFLMGHYDFIVKKNSSCYQYCPDGTERHHMSAYDAATGMPDPWNPAADTITGPFVAAVGTKRLYIAGEFNKINGRRQPGFAEFDMAPAPEVTTTTTASTATSSTSTSTSSTSTTSTSTTSTSTTSTSTSTSTTTTSTTTTSTTTTSTTTTTTTTTVPPQSPPPDTTE